jgi:hypothetical protein
MSHRSRKPRKASSDSSVSRPNKSFLRASAKAFRFFFRTLFSTSRTASRIQSSQGASGKLFLIPPQTREDEDPHPLDPAPFEVRENLFPILGAFPFRVKESTPGDFPSPIALGPESHVRGSPAFFLQRTEGKGPTPRNATSCSLPRGFSRQAFPSCWVTSIRRRYLGLTRSCKSSPKNAEIFGCLS